MAGEDEDRRLIEAAGLAHVFALFPEDVRAAVAQARAFNQTIAEVPAPLSVPGADTLPGEA